MSSSDQAAALVALLNLLIPPDPVRGLPGGSGVGFCPGPLADECLKVLENASREKFGMQFWALKDEEKSSLLSGITRAQKTWFLRLLKQLVEHYYLQPIVAAQREGGGRPPFPDGYHVEEGDLMLLEPVFSRGKIFKEL